MTHQLDQCILLIITQYLIHEKNNLVYAADKYSQYTLQKDAESNEALIGATIQISDTKGAIADAEGIATIEDLSSGVISVKVSFVGYEAEELTFLLPIEDIQVVKLGHHEEHEEVIVISTRTADVIEAIPTRVEVLGAEELGRKSHDAFF